MYLTSGIRQYVDVLVQLALVSLLHSLPKAHTIGIQLFAVTLRKLLLITFYSPFTLLIINLVRAKVVFDFV